MAGSEARRAPGFRQSLRRTLAELALVALAIALLVLAVRGCAGCLAAPIVAGLPPSVDQALGEAGAASFRAEHAGDEGPTPAQAARVARVFDELRAALTPDASRALISPRLTVLRDPQVNAFALPGGELFVLTGLLDRTDGDDDALRGVLAHELGHAVRRHGVRAAVEDGLYGVALAYLLGDLDGLTAALVAGASRLDALRHSRAMEREADAFAVDLLARAGHSPEGLARFLEGLDRQPVPELLSTHPDGAARARALREALPRPAH